MQYYQKKCQDLIDKSDTDSFCRAAANLMLNSDCQYLGNLAAKYKDKLGGQELKLDQNMELDEQKVQDIIDNIKNQAIRQRIISDESPMEDVVPSNVNITPHQGHKNYNEARIRGLETSEMTCVYDKENIQINKPKKGRPPIRECKEQFSSELQIENEGIISMKCSLERQPLKSLDKKDLS
jgi:hypothetical protein